jgi:hypothetical protein
MMYLKLILLSKLLLHPLQPLKMLPQTLALLLLLLVLKIQLSVGIDWKAQLKALQLELV